MTPRMRIRLAVSSLVLVAYACGDSGGATATTTTGDPQTTAVDATTGTSTSSTATTTGDAPTGSGSAEASSGDASTGPHPTTGAVLTATGDMTTADDTTGGTTSTSTATDTTSTTGTPADDTTSTGADDTTTSELPECDGADVAAILDAFVECPSPGYFGQTKPISGVTCWDICCAFGILNCGFRAAQADFDACNPMNAQPSGDCSDVFQMAWSSQCNCLN